MVHTTRLPEDIGETQTLARFLAGRYGALALTRAAGEAAAAERSGDRARTALWRYVIADLRQTIRVIEAQS